MPFMRLSNSLESPHISGRAIHEGYQKIVNIRRLYVQSRSTGHHYCVDTTAGAWRRGIIGHVDVPLGRDIVF